MQKLFSSLLLKQTPTCLYFVLLQIAPKKFQGFVHFNMLFNFQGPRCRLDSLFIISLSKASVNYFFHWLRFFRRFRPFFPAPPRVLIYITIHLHPCQHLRCTFSHSLCPYLAQFRLSSIIMKRMQVRSHK